MLTFSQSLNLAQESWNKWGFDSCDLRVREQQELINWKTGRPRGGLLLCLYLAVNESWKTTPAPRLSIVPSNNGAVVTWQDLRAFLEKHLDPVFLEFAISLDCPDENARVESFIAECAESNQIDVRSWLERNQQFTAQHGKTCWTAIYRGLTRVWDRPNDSGFTVLGYTGEGTPDILDDWAGLTWIEAWQDDVKEKREKESANVA